MVFSSLSFLFVFMPLLVLLFFGVPQRWNNARQYLLLFFSLIFYGSGEPRYIFLITICIIFTFLLSSVINSGRKWAFILSIVINIIPLLVTKYTGFFLSNINFLFKIYVRTPNIVMPIGISFYTFQVITYIVDLFYHRIDRQNNPLLFALYIMFFPQLVAGPIVKYDEIKNQLENPDISWDNIKYGTGRFIIGLGKKVLIANQAGSIADSIHSYSLSALTTGMTYLCMIAFMIQIYFDFSGYSDMAIGLGSIFGFHFPENFKAPYISESVTEFWRRWHITLGRFFRDYVYIPLGGNRVTRIRWVVNVFVVWFLTGLWHGASWNFVIWGVYYGILIIVEKVTGVNRKIPRILRWAITSYLIMLGWGIFMCDSFSVKEILIFLGKLLFINRTGEDAVITVASLKLWGHIPFLVLGIIISSPLGYYVTERLEKCSIENFSRRLVYALYDFIIIIILVLSIGFLMGDTYNPFIYFRF